MPEVDARLDTLEQRLTTLGQRMDERFQQVDQRFQQVDQRFQQVDQRFQQVDQRFGTLEAEVQKLRVLEEQNATHIKQIAEVQVYHGSVLDQHSKALQRLEDAIEPLKALPAALQKILPDHERRITALEKTNPGNTGSP